MKPSAGPTGHSIDPTARDMAMRRRWRIVAGSLAAGVCALGLAACGKKKDDGSYASLDVKEGDRVLFGKYAGTEVKLDGEDYLIMREDEIFAVVERK